MYKIVALWGTPKPQDVAAFEQYYFDVHVPLARKVPELKRVVLTRTDGGLEGAPAPFYRVAELMFDSPEALHRSAESPQWRAMREDAGKMVERFGVTLSAAMGWEADK